MKFGSLVYEGMLNNKPSEFSFRSDVQFDAEESCVRNMTNGRFSQKIPEDFKKSCAILGAALWLALTPSCKAPTESPSGPVGESYLHVRPSWSPDSKWIAFTATIKGVLGIYLVDSTGANLHLLIERDAIGTTWSPDGNWLALSSLGSLYRIKATGDSLARLTTGAGDIRPAWSRDGSRFCFVRRDLFGVQAIWMYDFRTGASAQLVPYGDYPSWHPNGKEIIILETQFDVPTNNFIYKFTSVNIESNFVQTLHALTSKSDCGFASISPRGDAIAYGLKPTDDYAQVWKFELSTGRHTRLTDDGGDFPAWSPDGTRIVYTRTQRGDGGLWAMNADGSGKHRLTSP